MILRELEEQASSPYQLTDEQVVQLALRREERKPKVISFEEARERFHIS